MVGYQGKIAVELLEQSLDLIGFDFDDEGLLAADALGSDEQVASKVN